jgi:hypothetical protein
MSEYVIEKLTCQARVWEGQYAIFLFKIDKYGNTHISAQSVTSGLGGTQFGAFHTQLIINDNIPIPIYLIETIQKLLHPDAETERQASYFNNVIQVIKQLKTSLKELSNNPQDAKDTKTQLEFSLNKNELLEKQLTEMENKIKNIQTAYFDTLKDNEKLKEEINRLKEKNKNLENELKNKKDTVYVNVPVENPKPRSLRDAFHNPGGATIYTKSNAANRMVYNEDTELWEHEEN